MQLFSGFIVFNKPHEESNLYFLNLFYRSAFSPLGCGFSSGLSMSDIVLLKHFQVLYRLEDHAFSSLQLFMKVDFSPKAKQKLCLLGL